MCDNTVTVPDFGRREVPTLAAMRRFLPESPLKSGYTGIFFIYHKSGVLVHGNGCFQYTMAPKNVSIT